MEKIMNKLLKSSLLVGLLHVSGGVIAEGSIQHFGQSTQHVAQSATHSAKAVGTSALGVTKLVSGVAAIPFKGLSAVGSLSDIVGDFLWENTSGETILEVTDETVTAGPAPFLKSDALTVANR
jgi:hypothetical protein